MQTAILNSDSKSNLKLVLDLAKKIGIKTRLLSDSELEDIGLVNAIKSGRTGEYIDTTAFLKKIKK
jgi:hypothetical protein